MFKASQECFSIDIWCTQFSFSLPCLLVLVFSWGGGGLAMSFDNSERNWGVQCRSREWFCQQQHSEILKPRKRDRAKIGHFCPFSLLMFKELLPGTFVFALITVLKRWKQLKAAAVKFWSSLVWSETEKGPEVDLYLSTLLLNCFGDKTLKWTAHPKTLGLKRFGTNLINEEDTKRKNQQKKTTICSELCDKREYTENCNEEKHNKASLGKMGGKAVHAQWFMHSWSQISKKWKSTEQGNKEGRARVLQLH